MAANGEKPDIAEAREELIRDICERHPPKAAGKNGDDPASGACSLEEVVRALQPSWREMSWADRLLSIVRAIFGLGDDRLTLLSASNIVPRKVKWLWPNRIPQGKLTLFVGNPDNGKSLVATSVAAVVTTGEKWPDAENTVPASEVWIFANEDDREDTIVPRLVAAGANRDKVKFATIVSDDPKVTQKEREMRLDQDIAAIQKALKSNPNIRLIIIDPVSNYLGGTKMVEEQAVRRVLTPLQSVAAETGVAILGIMHLNKKQDLGAINRIGGAMAFVGVARAVWLFAADTEIPDTFHMLRVKMNIGARRDGLRYRIATKPVEIQRERVPEPCVEWLGPSDKSADDVLSPKRVGRPRGERNDASQWLRTFLSDGPKPATEVESQCEAAGFSYRTLERCKEEIGAQSVSRDGKWYWELTQI